MIYVAKIGDRRFEVKFQKKEQELNVLLEGEMTPVELVRLSDTDSYFFKMKDRTFEIRIVKDDAGYVLESEGESYRCEVEDERLAKLKNSIKRNVDALKDRKIKSPMPGLVVAIEVEVDQEVKAGQGLIIIEAMKMENEINAPVNAIVKEIRVQPREAVEMGQTLVVIE